MNKLKKPLCNPIIVYLIEKCFSRAIGPYLRSRQDLPGELTSQEVGKILSKSLTILLWPC